MVWAQVRPVQGFLVQPVYYDCVPLVAPAASIDDPWPNGSRGELWGEEEMLTHKVCEQDDERS